MNRIKKCDDFLKYLVNIIKNNPDLNITDSTIYYELVRFGVDYKYQDVKANSLFQRWIEYFKDSPNIKVFVSNDWKYFCQFVKRGYAELENPIKMYIPIKPEYLEQSAKYIFDFIEQNNITHQSKIGTDIRNDNIVIRVYSKKNADMISNFVNNNSYIQKGLMETNPFSFQKDGIAYAIDGKISYNVTVSQYIFMYIQDKLKNNMLNTININDFKEYLLNIYNDVFVNLNTNDFINKFGIKSENLSSTLNNYKEVTRLIFYSLNNGSFKKYMQEVDLVNDSEKVQKEINTFEDKKLIDKDTDLFNEYIMTTISKYGLETAIRYFKSYIYSYNINAITRDDNLRKRMTDRLSPLKCQMIIDDNIDEYISNLYNFDLDAIKLHSLKNAIKYTFLKYGSDQVYAALKMALDGNFCMFTNDNNGRENLIHTVNYKDIEDLIKRYMNKEIIDNKVIMDFVDNITINLERTNSYERR